MGLDGYYSTGNRNSGGQIIETTIGATPFTSTGLNGPKFDYYNVGNVGWQGLNGLVEYNSDNTYNVVLQGGLSNQSTNNYSSAWACQSRELVAHTLSSARWHDDKSILAGSDTLYNGLLISFKS